VNPNMPKLKSMGKKVVHNTFPTPRDKTGSYHLSNTHYLSLSPFSSSPFIFLSTASPALARSPASRDDQNPDTEPRQHATRPAATANSAASRSDGENHSAPSPALLISLVANNSSADAEAEQAPAFRALERSPAVRAPRTNGGSVGPREARTRHRPLRRRARAPEGLRGRAAGGGGAVFGGRGQAGVRPRVRASADELWKPELAAGGDSPFIFLSFFFLSLFFFPVLLDSCGLWRAGLCVWRTGDAEEMSALPLDCVRILGNIAV
jgi:hypothetical protein